MKKYMFILLITVCSLSSCRKAVEIKYSSRDNIFLDFDDAKTKDRDSVIFTFAYAPEKLRDTVFFPVRISGVRRATDRKFKVVVLADGTTAEPGKHYEALRGEYTIAANTGSFRLPVIVLNTDPALATKSVALNFRLIASDDFNADIINVTKARLILSNKLEKPYWWGPGNNTWGIPNYSQVKHELWLLSTGAIALPFNGLNAPQYLYYIGLLNNLLNNPATWIANNPGKGYVLQLQSDGNYYFYNASNPAKKTLYRKNTQTGKFFFVDEMGKDVI